MTNFRQPTDEQIEEAVRRIPTPQLRQAFFEGLKNPLWLVPLSKAGLFANPPEPEETPDGMVRDIYWPEINYLIRVAPSVPKEVVDVLLGLTDSNNAWVRRAVFTIGASVPAEQAARLKTLLKSWLKSGFGWRTDPRQKVDFAVNLLRGGEYATGKWVANILFRPAIDGESRNPTRFLDDYWYVEGLPRLVEALSDGGFEVVLSWLVDYERQIKHLTETSDLTYFSRESIRAVSPDALSGHESVEHALIDAVRDLAIAAMRSNPSPTVRALLNTRMVLGRKLALFALAETLGSDGLTDEQRAGLLDQATALLGEASSREDDFRIEYAELARSVAVHDREYLVPLVEYFSAGPPEGTESIRGWLRRDEDETEEELETRVIAWVDSWTHRWLAAIGYDALPDELRPVLEELNARLGEVENPLTPRHRVTSWVGPNSPITQGEMAAMSPTELVAHLESWHDSGDGWGPEPSHEGPGRELTALLTTNPNALFEVDRLITRLRPTYIRAILRGWEGALKAGLDLRWDDVADLLREVFAHSDESQLPVEGGAGDDDSSFRWAKQAAVSLLVDLVANRVSPTVPDKWLAIFARLLLRDADDEAAWIEYDEYDSRGGMDPLTMSLNWQWPIRVRGLVNLLAHGPATPWYAEAQTEFASEISRVDRWGASRAVIGEGLGRLLSADADWIGSVAPALFGTVDAISRDQQFALTTAITVYGYHKRLYGLLGPGMVASIRSETPLATGWDAHTDPLQKIGEWVIYAIIFGHATSADPVAEAFYEEVEPKIRGEAIGAVAWSFMHAEAVEDTILDRLAALWDTRVEHVRSRPDDASELRQFYWFVRSRKYAPEWWLPRLSEALELDPQLASERYMIGKEIALAADTDPNEALTVTRSLLEFRDESGMQSWDLTHNAVPMVIGRAMSAGSESLRKTAIEFMNSLGEQGYRELEREVQSVLDGSITQQDVSD